MRSEAPSPIRTVDAKVRKSHTAARATRVAAMDEWVTQLLGRSSDVAVVAVGGYGRRELAPASDLDLLLLHRRGQRVGELADRVWYPIWDSGLRLDHAVRTVDEAAALARSDLRVVLGLLHGRHIAGDARLTGLLLDAVRGDWRADACRRLPELRTAVAERAYQHGELAFLSEPELKEARGGLRDVHAMQAVAAAWVAEGPCRGVQPAYELILDTRHALHDATGRVSDRLILQEQGGVAEALGLLGTDALLRALSEAGRRISHASDLTWRQVDRHVAARTRRGRPRGRRPSRRPLASDVVEQERRRQAYEPPAGVPAPPPRVAFFDDASRTATVVEVRAHDRP